MSLILEALKKVERERTAAQPRGFLVVGPSTWGASRSNAAWIAGMIAAAVIAGAGVYLATRPRPPVLPTAGAVAEAPAFAPAPEKPTVVPAALRLQAISERDGAPIAVVNDRLVRVGDLVDGARVLRIAPTEVLVEVDGGRRTLRF